MYIGLLISVYRGSVLILQNGLYRDCKSTHPVHPVKQRNVWQKKPPKTKHNLALDKMSWRTQQDFWVVYWSGVLLKTSQGRKGAPHSTTGTLSSSVNREEDTHIHTLSPPLSSLHQRIRPNRFSFFSHLLVPLPLLCSVLILFFLQSHMCLFLLCSSKTHSHPRTLLAGSWQSATSRFQAPILHLHPSSLISQ